MLRLEGLQWSELLLLLLLLLLSSKCLEGLELEGVDRSSAQLLWLPLLLLLLGGLCQ